MFEAIRLHSWYAMPQGQVVVRLISEVLNQWWRGQQASHHALGFGFAQPYFGCAAHWTHSLLGASPAEMGVMPWPADSNRVALVRPDALPFPDATFDRVIMTHLLEGSFSAHAVLRESWRVLEPGGRLLLMVTNRGGLWARHDSTPFGWGRPFSPRQVRTLLEEAFFIPRQFCYALFMPPLSGDYWLRTASAWEKAGQRWFAPLGGVILAEAEKVVYAVRPLHQPARMMSGPMVIPVTERHQSHPCQSHL
ncbi:MAG: methyltransferase domain-containing protein [Magnetococcales bacterium]|nr:methyltransferase domain-containing protein [Magnetococcales bacterium]